MNNKSVRRTAPAKAPIQSEVIAVLMKMEAAFDARLRAIEGPVEGLLMAHRGLGIRFDGLEAQIGDVHTELKKLADENRQWRRHCERLLRAKESLLEALGRQSFNQAVSIEGLNTDDIARALREVKDGPMHRNAGN